MVVRNSQDLVIASLSQQLPQAFQSLEIEAIGTSRALEFGIEVKVHQAILFSSLITPHSIFLTPHSLFKIPQFPNTHPFGNYFQFTSLNYFYYFVGPTH